MQRTRHTASVEPDSSSTYDVVLRRLAQDAVDKYNKFKDAFSVEQAALREVTVGRTGQKDASPGPKHSDFARFAGVRSQTGLKGNVDPVQIRETLYDSQGVRAPSPLVLTIEESSGAPSAEGQLEMLTAVADNARARVDQLLDDVAKESDNDSENRELASQVENIVQMVTLPEPMGAEAEITPKGTRPSPSLAKEITTVKPLRKGTAGIPELPSMLLPSQPPSVEGLIKDKVERQVEKSSKCLPSLKIDTKESSEKLNPSG